MMYLSFKKAFTLVELMIVIAIIGILAAALFPSMTSYIQRSRDVATQSNIRKLVPILQNYLTDVGGFSGVIDNQWYCIPLQNGSCESFMILPNFQSLPFQRIDFSTQSTGYPNPFIMRQTALNGEPATRLFTGGVTYPKYVLHWTLPGGSGTDQVLGEPEHIPQANARCSPGLVRWINVVSSQTACHMIIY